MTTIGVGPLNPNGWTPASVPGQFPLPDNDGRATALSTCGATDSTGATSVLARYALDNSGDWDAAYYYAVRFADWSGPGANSPHTSGNWRSWTFTKAGASGEALSAWILASGTTMFVGYSAGASSNSGDTGSGGGGGGGGAGGGTGQITVNATFIGTSTPCSGTDVNVSGPNGYTDSDQTGGDGTLTIANLTPGTYQVTGGGGQAANPVVNGAGVATATVTVTAGGDQEVQFGCS